jgi:hypothetical protein
LDDTLPSQSGQTRSVISHDYRRGFTGLERSLSGSHSSAVRSIIWWPLNPNNVRNRQLKPLMKRVGAPWAGFHALRHTFVSIQVREQGCNVLALAKGLGHSDPASPSASTRTCLRKTQPSLWTCPPLWPMCRPLLRLSRSQRGSSNRPRRPEHSPQWKRALFAGVLFHALSRSASHPAHAPRSRSAKRYITTTLLLTRWPPQRSKRSAKRR